MTPPSTRKEAPVVAEAKPLEPVGAKRAPAIPARTLPQAEPQVGAPASRSVRPDPRHEAAVVLPPPAQLLAVSVAVPSGASR